VDDTTQPIGLPALAATGDGVPAPGPGGRTAGPGRPDPGPVSSRLLRFLVLGAGGLAVLLAGLALDAVLHARDPGLAAGEGVFTLSNPGHLLAGAGIALVVVGLAGALATVVLAGRAGRPLPAVARLGMVGGALALALVAGGAGVWAAGTGGQHDHNPAGAAAHVHDSPEGPGTAAPDMRGTAGADGAGTPAHAHGPNLPDLAAAGAEERARAEALWKASIANAQPWRDPDAAAAAGFRFKGRDRAGERPVRFVHVPNPAWRADGRILDPARPETLIYWRGPKDRLLLVGVMYTAATGAPGPAVGGPITRWHDHESCRDPGTRAKLGRPVDGACPDGQVFRRSGEMMHVWFTDDLATAYARRAPLGELRAFAAASTAGSR
jgi:hypothetical protein